MRARIFNTLFLFIFGFTFWANAQTTQNQDLPSLGSPYSTVYTHLYFLQADSYNPGLAATTIYGIKDTLLAQSLAIKLKQILDGQGLFVELETLPKNRNFIDSTTQKPYFTPFPKELPEVYLERIDSSWYYSRETVSLVPGLHRKVYPLGSDALVNLFPKMGQTRFLGLAYWQYLGILILLVMAWLTHKLLSRMINPVIKWLSHRYLSDAGVVTGQVWKAARFLSILVVIILLRLFVPALLLPIKLGGLLHKGLSIFIAVFAVLFLLRIIDLVMLYAKKFTQTTTQKYDEQILPILKRSLQIVAVLAATFQVLQLLDINVTALIAGLSIGGLALALAAQDTVKNFIGSAMIFIDRPFQIGDYIEWSGEAGTVMEVGFRSTRIRTSDTSIISVPNGTISNVATTNKGMRVYRLLLLQLSITYDTPPALIETFVKGLRELVQRHPLTQKEEVYIHLNNMNASSLDVLFRVFLQVPSFAEELKTKEELLFGILRLAETLGIRFAFPSSSVYVEQFPEKGNPNPPYLTDTTSTDEKLSAFLKEFERRNQV